MPRKNLIRQSLFPYHVFIRTNNRDWFGVPMRQVWDIAVSSLIVANQKVPIDLHCFVLMNNHYHMLISTPDANIDKFMEYFNRRLSNCIKRVSGHENHKFANRYKWTIINSQSYLYNVYRYIYQNPVRAGITQNCIDYPYSSLNFNSIQLKSMDLNPHLKYNDYKQWIEHVPSTDINSSIRRGLRKHKFKLANKTPVPIQKQLTQVPIL